MNKIERLLNDISPALETYAHDRYERLYHWLLGLLNSTPSKKEDQKLGIALSTSKIPSDVANAHMLPKGSAIITSSGKLKETGITAIIHAATGSMTQSNGNFEPTPDSIADSVKNSLKLAQQNGHKRIAIPILGGNIFLSRMGVTQEQLVSKIVDTVLANRGNLEVRLVGFAPGESDVLNRVLKAKNAKLPKGAVEVVDGSIVDFKVHGASAIVNAANMEVKFGGGLSGVIARATGMADQIDDEAQKKIDALYKLSPENRAKLQ